MLDDLNIISGRDPSDALGVTATQPEQANFAAEIDNIDLSDEAIETVIVAGMGGSALAAGIAGSWLRFAVPFEVVRRYNLPDYVNEKTLVIVSSYSGNTEEALQCLEEAEAKQAKIAIISSGGQLVDQAQETRLPLITLPGGIKPRYTIIYQLRALTKLFEAYGLAEGKFDEIASVSDWLHEHSQGWLPHVPTGENLAKQLAEKAAGKIPVIYSGSRMTPVAYKWKISFNENAKNVAFYNELPEFDHNELLGWASHPVEKPFVVFDLISGFEHPQVLRRFEISDRLLSGLRPKAIPIELQGESVIAQMLWGCQLADFVSTYLAILNGVDPTEVDLIDKLKQELA